MKAIFNWLQAALRIDALYISRHLLPRVLRQWLFNTPEPELAPSDSEEDKEAEDASLSPADDMEFVVPPQALYLPLTIRVRILARCVCRCWW